MALWPLCAFHCALRDLAFAFQCHSFLIQHTNPSGTSLRGTWRRSYPAHSVKCQVNTNERASSYPMEILSIWIGCANRSDETTWSLFLMAWKEIASVTIVKEWHRTFFKTG